MASADVLSQRTAPVAPGRLSGSRLALPWARVSAAAAGSAHGGGGGTVYSGFTAGGGGGGGDGHFSRGQLTLADHWTERSTMARSRSSGSGSQSRGVSARSLFINPFGFESKTSYQAGETLALFRSDDYAPVPAEPDNDIWKRPPPDFRPQCYAPKPPKRNSAEAMQPWRYGTLPGEGRSTAAKKPTKAASLPNLLLPRDPEPARFVTEGFDIPDPFEARVLGAREGTNEAGVYVPPKPHDFRDYPPLKKLGLDEFDTTYEHDPFNLKFKSERLDIIHDRGAARATDRDTAGRQMAPPLPAQPQWEARLILPRSPFPTRPAEYSRYRRQNRSPHTALMDRIEEHLNRKWTMST